MADKAFLVLEDGTVFEGEAFGAPVAAHGEVVFDTSMAGYQEALTDPSFAGQIMVLTYPLAGNYGINKFDVESKRVQVSGMVVREHCPIPSHWQSEMTLHDYLAANGIPGLSGIDTRALTRRLRIGGVMMGMISSEGSPEDALRRLAALPRYGEIDYAAQVTAEKPFQWRNGAKRGRHIVVIDLGVKYNIMRLLSQRGCRVTVVPCNATTDDISELKPDGIVLSPGPGDPAHLSYTTRTVGELVGKIPFFGICLGHQVLGAVFGGHSFKMKFGHRGANHPVRDLATGHVYITAQNHGYALDPDSLGDGIEVSHINVNDDTVEGLRHRELPLMSIQYHSEASPGPLDNVYFFDRFLEMVNESGKR